MKGVGWLLGPCILALAVSAASAQTGAITVVVVDDQGRALPGANVTISNETGYVKTTAQLTDKNGVVEFPVLRPGRRYTIQVAFPGFSPIRQEDLNVKVNDPLLLTVQMIEQIEEQVTVTAERQVIDLDATQTSTKFSDNFIADLPVPGRFYQNVLTLAPGVQDADGDGNPNVHGSRERDFSAIVGGVRNVDPLTGQWMSRINPNSIEEMEVITAGAGVEFGRAQGGFARIIQKQGSNEFEGVFEFYYRTSKLDGGGIGVSSTIDDPEFDDPDFQWIQPAIQISGPIIKDKLWYRLSHEYRRIEEPVNVTSRFEITTFDEWTHSDQLTWQVSPRNKLALQFQADPSTATNFGVSSVRPGDAAWDRERSGESYSLIWTAPYSPQILVDSLVAWQDLNFALTPTSQGVRNQCVAGEDFLELSQCRNLETGLISGSYYRTQNDHSQRLTVGGKATIYSRIGGMSHQFKVGIGVENERYFRELTQQRNGIFFSNLSLDPVNPQSSPVRIPQYFVRLATPESDDVRATGTNWSLYAEDQFKPAQNLTLTAGLRIDHEEINSSGRSQFDPAAELAAYEEFVEAAYRDLILIGNPAPEVFFARVSEAWPRLFTGFEDYDSFERQLQDIICEGAEDIGNCQEVQVSQTILDQRQRDLHNTRRAEDINISNTNLSPFLSVAWSPWSNGKTAIKAAVGRHYNNIPLIVPLQELEPTLTELHYREDSDSGRLVLVEGIQPTLTVQTVDRDLKTPYQDELTFKLERELWAETTIALTYINRQFRDQIQDININWATGDYGVCSASPTEFGPVSPSYGSGHTVTDPFTRESYLDTDPGIGDGRTDDCSGADVRVQGSNATVRRPDGRADLYVQNPFWGDVFLIGNFNSIDYEAFVLELVRRQFRSWEMQASYTYSEAIGDGEDFFQELGNDPSLRQNSRGYQSYDQRHVVKLNATTITAWGFRLGTALSWQSGLPYSILYEQFAEDLVPGWTERTNLASVSGRARQSYPTGGRNDQRNRSYWNVDLRATKEVDLGRGLNLQLSAEIFNLLNDGTYTVYNTFNKSGMQVNGVNEAFNRFGRRWQLGLKLAF